MHGFQSPLAKHTPTLYSEESSKDQRSSSQCTWIFFICGGPADPLPYPCKSDSDAETDDTTRVPRGHRKFYHSHNEDVWGERVPKPSRIGLSNGRSKCLWVALWWGWRQVSMAWSELPCSPQERRESIFLLACLPGNGTTRRWRRGWGLNAVGSQISKMEPDSLFPFSYLRASI